MKMKYLIRAAAAAGVVAGAAHLIRKHNLVERAGVLAERGVVKVEAGIARGVALADELLTKFADSDATTPVSAPAATPATEDAPGPRTPGESRVGFGDVTS